MTLRRPPKGAWGALLLLVSCSDQGFFSSWPDALGRASSAVLILEQDQARTVEAFEAQALLDRAVSIETEELQAELRLYEQTLNELGLSPGVIEVVSESECGSQRLEPPTQSFFLEFSSTTGIDGWTELDAPPQTLFVAGPCPCSTFELERSYVVEGSSAELKVQLRSGLIFEARDADFLATYYFNGEEPTVVDEQIPGRLRTGYEREDGELLLISADRVFRGRLGAEFTITSTLPADGAEGFDGAPSGALESYVAFTSNRLYRSEGDAWIRIEYEWLGGSGGRQIPNVVWLGPGRMLATVPDASFIVSYADGVSTSLIVDSNSRGIRKLVLSDDLGPVAGGFTGQLYVLREGSFSTLFEQDEGGGQIGALEPWPGGVLYARGDGLGQVLDTEAGPLRCPLGTPIPGSELVALGRLGNQGRVLVLGRSPSEVTAAVLRATPTP